MVSFTPAFAPDLPKSTQVYHNLLLTPWMFIGFESISMVSADLRFPAKKAGFIMPMAIVCGLLTYIMLNLISAAAAAPFFGRTAVS